MDNKKLQDFVNSSGFPLQIGIQNQVESTFSVHGWKVLAKELPWRNAETGNNGFVDIVLQNQYDTQRLIIECKRVRDSHWIFLEPSTKHTERYHAQFWFTRVQNDNTKRFDWFDAAVEPPSPEAEFCIVPGQDPKSKPMLERTAAELVEATEAFASEEYRLHKKDEFEFFSFYFSAIVTTAQLQVCNFNPDNVCLEKGEIDQSAFRVVPYLRFRKSLLTRQLSLAGQRGIKTIIKAQEQTVFIVNSLHLVEFIKNLEIQDSSTTYKQLFA